MTEQDRETKDVDPMVGDQGAALQERGDRQPMGAPAAGGMAGEAQTETGKDVDPLQDALKEAADNRDRWMRAVAELENFRKRALQEKNKFYKYKNEDLLRDLLPIADNMERARCHCQAQSKADAVAEGINMIAGMFSDLLARYGVTEIKAKGEPFDPHVHEALARTNAVEGQQPNTVAEVLEKGYMYQDRLLRPAKVVVAVAPTGD